MNDVFQEDIKKRKEMLKALGLRLKNARSEARLSQLQVGVIIGVTDKTISSYEAGRVSPPIDKLLHLADIFKKPISYFLGDNSKDYKFTSRLRAVEMALKEIRKQLIEIKELSNIKD